jgi:hypothetical protein
VLTPERPGFVVSVAARIVDPRDLAPAAGASGLHALAVRARRCSSRSAARVHRIPPHDRDDAFAPLAEAGRAHMRMIFRKTEAGYFRWEGWTNAIFFGFA